jgi:hypothetical protein
MKKIIPISLLILTCSCKQAAKDSTPVQTIDNPVSTKSNIDDDFREPIDSAEFVLFWKQFRKAILEHDTIALATMVSDSIRDGQFLLRDYKEQTDKLTKSLFLNNLYQLFTPEFLSLLKSYDIDKNLYSPKNDIKTLYRCRKKIGDRIYRSYMVFYYGQTVWGIYSNTVNYYMTYNQAIGYFEECVTQTKGLFIEEDLGHLNNLEFQFGFVQTSVGIKLYNLGFSYNITISD